MSFRVEAGRFALVGFPEAPLPADFELFARAPAQLVRESGETTLFVREEELARVLARHPRAEVVRGRVWIRFEAPMDWDLVGFLAHVAGELAEAGIPIGAVCGFSRDHLFVAEAHLEQARAVLSRSFPEIRSVPEITDEPEHS